MSKSNYTSHLREKEKAKLNAALAKPEKPRWGDEANLAMTMADMESKMPNENSATMDLFNDLEGNWSSGRKGGAGDALISGIKSGFKKGSILDDKQRMKKYQSGMEKTYAMIQQQNQELARQENLYNAQEAMVPRIGAYLEQARGMSPDSRTLYVQRAMDEYNRMTGTNYKVASVDGVEPWKVTAMDGDEAQVIDLMDFIKTPQEKRLQLYMNSPGYQQMEGGLKAEHNTEQAVKTADIQLKKAKIDELRQESQNLQSFKELEDSVRQESGDSVVALDRFIDKPSQWNHAIKGIEKRIEQGNTAHKGMQTLDRLDEIVNNKPELFGTFDAIITNANSAEPTLLSTLATKLKVKDEDRADFEEAGKLFAYLYQDALHTLPSGTRANQYLEREIKKGIPSMGQVPEAFRRITSHIRKEFVHPSEVGKKTSEYYQKGLEYRPKIREYNKQLTAKDAEKMTTEELEAERERLKGVK